MGRMDCWDCGFGPGEGEVVDVEGRGGWVGEGCCMCRLCDCSCGDGVAAAEVGAVGVGRLACEPETLGDRVLL